MMVLAAIWLSCKDIHKEAFFPLKICEGCSLSVLRVVHVTLKEE